MEHLNLLCNKVAALRFFHPTISSVLFEAGSCYFDTVSQRGEGRVRGANLKELNAFVLISAD